MKAPAWLSLAAALFLCACPLWPPLQSPDASATPSPQPSPEPEWIVIRVGGSHFRPALGFSAPATLTLDYGEGSDALELQLPAGQAVIPDHPFADAEQSHDVRLLVQPWSALSILNLGYRAGDGGNDTFHNDVPAVDFHPSTQVAGCENSDDVLTAAAIRAYVGEVLALSHLDAAPFLDALCLEQQALTELDCSGLSALRTVEAFRSELKATNFSGCASLRRCCLESTGARESFRWEGGIRLSDESLDLRDSPLLQDIRGTNGDHVLLRLHPDALDSLWHLCKMANPRLNAVQLGEGEPAPLDPGAFSALLQCWLSGSPVVDDLVLDNGVTESLWLSGCGISSIDCSGQSQLYQLEAPGNPLASLDISGCSGLDVLDLAGCGLETAQVDAILQTMDAFGLSAGTYDAIRLGAEADYGLTDANAPPSAEGIAHAESLRSRGWTVVVNP